MTTERQLLKEAAEIMKSVRQVAGDVRFVNEIKNDLTVSIENIEAHLSQPDAVAMTLGQAKDKVAISDGWTDWDHLENECTTPNDWYKACRSLERAARQVIESNLVHSHELLNSFKTLKSISTEESVHGLCDTLISRYGVYLEGNK